MARKDRPTPSPATKGQLDAADMTELLGNERADGAEVVVEVRLDPGTLGKLDDIGGAMRPKATRARLIEAAVAAYVERHGEPKK